MSNVVVTIFTAPLVQDTMKITFKNAEIHMSTNGVLCIRNQDSRKVLAAYNAGVWALAEVEV